MGKDTLIEPARLRPLFATGWSLDGTGRVLEKTFLFKDFVHAFAFMAKVAYDAEAMKHHPDWSNSYRTVTVRLTTHDSGGLTEKDLELATRMDRIAGY